MRETNRQRERERQTIPFITSSFLSRNLRLHAAGVWRRLRSPPSSRRVP